MFGQNQTFSSFSVHDIELAREFYRDALGLDVKDEQHGELRITFANGGVLLIYPRPNHQAASFTVLNFIVKDIDKAVDDLVAKDVIMEQYDMPGIKTDAKGIARDETGAIAWFKDPAGNILSVVTM